VEIFLFFFYFILFYFFILFFFYFLFFIFLREESLKSHAGSVSHEISEEGKRKN